MIPEADDGTAATRHACLTLAPAMKQCRKRLAGRPREEFRMNTRCFVAAALLAPLAAALPAHGQDYPSRPIQLVVPYGPGGVADVGMRIMAEKLSARLKQQVVVENRPGAGGIVAAKAVATSSPDGYNVLMTGNNTAIAVALFKTLPYDILKDFASTSTVSFFDLLIVVKAGSPLKSVADIVKTAKANPGKLNIGTINPGSTQNLAAELFKSVNGINVQIVPFRTSADMATALLRGDLDVMFEFFTAAHGLLSDNKIVALASTGPKRSAYLPQVPTAQEAGIKDFEVVSWNGISVPTGTPKNAIDTLVKGINDVLPDPTIQERAKTLGMDMHGSTPAEMDKRMKDDIVKWSAVIDKAGIQKQ
jgi:tripartite-type tricarboxylate transporter receptor subunit TctC